MIPKVFTMIKNNQDRMLVGRLYNDYRYLMLSQAYKILKDYPLAEDAVHEAFIRIAKNLHKIDENNCPRTRKFLVIICENIAKDMLRKRLQLDEDCQTTDEIDKIPLAGSDPLNIILNNESKNDIRETVKQLKPIYHDVVVLKIDCGFNNEEIASLLNISTETVKKRFQRGRDMLIKMLNRKEALK